MNTETVTWADMNEHVMPTLRVMGRAASDLSARLDALELAARAAEPAPLPASPTEPEPIPAPETPEQTATRLLGDPEAFAEVLRLCARQASSVDRQALHDEIASQEARYHSCAAGLRLLAAAIAAGSFA